MCNFDIGRARGLQVSFYQNDLDLLITFNCVCTNSIEVTKINDIMCKVFSLQYYMDYVSHSWQRYIQLTENFALESCPECLYTIDFNLPSPFFCSLGCPKKSCFREYLRMPFLMEQPILIRPCLCKCRWDQFWKSRFERQPPEQPVLIYPSSVNSSIGPTDSR